MSRIAAIVIGRNEGERLKRCLAALSGIARVIYVDSGSTDGSVAHARSIGAEAVDLDLSLPFTAARARNAGIARLRGNPPDLVQFLDGDCEMREGWLDAAQAFMVDHPAAGVVCGRRRERFPEASRYNRLIDLEWDTPLGQVKSCGGDALMRWAALEAVGGYDPNLIAGEEPELCVRLRRAGWQIWRIDREMTWHDAQITRLSQWWRRARRAGHAFSEGAALHGAPPERHNVAQRNRALIWGLGLPALALLGALITPWALLILLIWPLQILRLARRSGDAEQALFLTFGKIPEALGILDHHWRRMTGRGRGRLIEYK
jgi:GT2 family glycosyltransferase